MNEDELIEYQEVIDALSGIKTFIPGTSVFQRWGGKDGKYSVRYMVLSRTKNEVTLLQMPAYGGYRYKEEYSESITSTISRSPFDGHETCCDGTISAKNSC